MSKYIPNDLNTGDVITNSAVDKWDKGLLNANNPRKFINILNDKIALCKDETIYTTAVATLANDSGNGYGNSESIEATLSGSSGSFYYDILSLLDTSKYYLFFAKVKNGDLTGSGIRMGVDCVGDGSTNFSSYVTSTDYTTKGVVVQPGDFDTATELRIVFNMSGSSTEKAYVSSLCFVEITASEYAEGVTALLSDFPFVSLKGQETFAQVTHLDSDDNVEDGRVDVIIQGQSTVNLLDDDVAGCESTSGWTNFQSTDATDSSDELEGTNCLKVTITSTSGQIYRDVLSLLDTTKYYMYSAHIKNGDLSGSGVRLKCAFTGGGTTQNSSYHTETYYKREAVIFSSTEMSGASAINIYTEGAGANTEFYFMDALAIHEISVEDYNNASTNGVSVLFDKYPYHRGLKGVESKRVKSVGKNLIFEKNVTLGYRVDNTGSLVSSGSYCVSEPIRIKPDTTYYLKNGIGVSSYYSTAIFDFNNNFLRNVNLSGSGLQSGTIATGNNAFYIRINLLISELDNNTIQFEQGSTATDYEPYTETQAHTHETLHSVPNGTYDEENLNTGVLVNRVSNYTVGTITGVANGTNVTRAFIGAFADNEDWVTNDTNLYVTNADGEILQRTNSATYDNTSEIGKYYVANNQYIYFIVTLGTTVGGAETLLADYKMYYKLATPTTTYYQPQLLQGYSSGTIYSENAIQETLTYDSGITITDSTRPISSLDYIYLIDTTTNKETLVDLSDATVASGGGSFTLSGASDGDRYRFGYYPVFGSAQGLTHFETCRNTKDESEGNTASLVDLDKKVEFINSKVNFDKGVWEEITDYTVEGSADSQIDIDNISELYTHFKMFITGISSTTTTRNLTVRFNDDSANNYEYYHYHQEGTGANNNTAGTSSAILGDEILVRNDVNSQTMSVITFNNSNASYYKQYTDDTIVGTAGSAQMRTIGGGTWMNNSDKISKISLIPSADAIGVNSRIILLGRR